MERSLIHIRLPRDLVKKVDHAAIDADLDRARTIEEMLAFALNSGWSAAPSAGRA